MWLLWLSLLAEPVDAPGLRAELSPYLVGSAVEPVAWRPWGDGSALAASRRARRPVLLAIGEFASRECRERDQRLFGEAQAARLLNERFVSIKVDRDERPAVGAAYETLLTGGGSLGGSGAVFLLAPDGLPLHAVSPEEQEPEAFRALLARAAGARDDAGDGRKASPRALPLRGQRKGAAGEEAREAALRGSLEALTRREAGVPVRTSAPGPLRLMLREGARPDTVRVATDMLEALARSGLRDHLAGGFHRGPGAYEKLIGHNALLLRSYAEAAAASGNLLLRDVAQETAAWMIRDLRDVSGLFWSSVAAPMEGPVGSYYLWTGEEVVRWLGPDRAGEFLNVYVVEPPGLLTLKGSPFAGLDSSREVLLNRRGRRVRLPVNDEVLTAWNGLAIGALAREGRLLRRGSDVEAARRAAEALLQRAGPATDLKRCVRGSRARVAAPLEDHAYLAEGLLDLYDATAEPRWKAEAAAIVDAAVARFWDADGGGFFETDSRERLPVRLKLARDGELPAGNGIMASVLLRLARLTGDARYDRRAMSTIDAFLPELERDPRGFETLSAALAESLIPRDR